MASLNLSTNGASISKSYQSVVNAPPPSGKSANSPTYGVWALFSVAAPLVNAFQPNSGGKESVLKVQTSGDGELADLIDEFSDGKVQFAFVKVRDPNTSLPKNVLIAWCGEGVPERTKGYFTSHLAAVSKLLHGYHVQITARSEEHLSPEGIIKKVADSSGSKYSSNLESQPSASDRAPPSHPPKPSQAYTPTRVGGSAPGFNPLAGTRPTRPANVDEDGWGEDAPPVTRTQLEKVESAYKPTKVNIKELTSQKPEPSRFSAERSEVSGGAGNVVKGGYQPIGKVDIAAIRREAQESGKLADDRPAPVKGSYEPVGKVDIAAIKARSQPPSENVPAPPSATSPAPSAEPQQSKSISERSAAFTPSERLTSLPKPKVANKFGSSAGAFTGTKAPTPVTAKPAAAAAGAPAVGAASRAFADEGGKTPSQLWAEKKARQRAASGAADTTPAPYSGTPASPLTSQPSGGEWKSGYTGKSWAPVQTTHTGKSGSSLGQQRTGQEAEEEQPEVPKSPAAGIGSLRDRFQGAPPMGAPALPKQPSREEEEEEPVAPAPPPLETTTKPNAGAARGVPIPGLPTRAPAPEPEYEPEPEPEPEEEPPAAPQAAPRLPTPPPQPRSPSPPTPPIMRSGSPIQIAMPVGRGKAADIEPPEERFSPPPVPVESLAKVVPHEEELTEEPEHHDTAREAGAVAAEATFGHEAAAAAGPGAHVGGKRALIQYDYEKAEDNEIDLVEGQYVSNIEMIDEDWWMGQNEKGETGLFPSNYVEVLEDGDDGEHAPPVPAATEHDAAVPDIPEHYAEAEAAPPAGPAPGAAGSAQHGATATAQYDYEAAEDNELSFPEGAKILNIEFPDEDWWFGEYNGKTGLFPANYVQIDE